MAPTAVPVPGDVDDGALAPELVAQLLKRLFVRLLSGLHVVEALAMTDEPEDNNNRVPPLGHLEKVLPRPHCYFLCFFSGWAGAAFCAPASRSMRITSFLL